jgi:hypothetical protein
LLRGLAFLENIPDGRHYIILNENPIIPDRWLNQPQLKDFLLDF